MRTGFLFVLLLSHIGGCLPAAENMIKNTDSPVIFAGYSAVASINGRCRLFGLSFTFMNCIIDGFEAHKVHAVFAIRLSQGGASKSAFLAYDRLVTGHNDYEFAFKLVSKNLPSLDRKSTLGLPRRFIGTVRRGAELDEEGFLGGNFQVEVAREIYWGQLDGSRKNSTMTDFLLVREREDIWAIPLTPEKTVPSLVPIYSMRILDRLSDEERQLLDNGTRALFREQPQSGRVAAFKFQREKSAAFSKAKDDLMFEAIILP